MNQNHHADTFKPSPVKFSEDSFEPVLSPKSEKTVVQNTSVATAKLVSPPTTTEPASSPSTSPSPFPSTSPPPPTPPAELLATADPRLQGALGHASPEILAALQVHIFQFLYWQYFQEAAPENLRVFLTFEES